MTHTISTSTAPDRGKDRAGSHGPVRLGDRAGGRGMDLAGGHGMDRPGGRGEDAGRALPFLNDKLRIPEPCFPVLHRRRVSALLDKAIQHRVTLVSGPAGAGKTVACASWAAAAPPGGRVIWLTVDPDDQRDWFWAYVCTALTRVQAAPPGALAALEDTGPEGFPLRLVEIAQSFTAPVVLVLDDVHEVTDAGLLNGLDVLIRHAPAALRLVLLARRPPALQLARLRVSGALADIGAADLACTAEEADAYFAMLGLAAGPAERDEVMRRTEGWMAGLRMAAMRARPGGAGAKITDLAGAEPLVTDYLWDEVLGRQEPDTRAFLARTSVVGELCGDLADTLTGESGGVATLARLSRENCLVAALDADADAYRYHPLLREVLTAELHRQFPHEVPVLLGRAARWYADHGRPLDCVRAAIAAQDWDQAAAALAGSAVEMLMSGGPRELEPVLALFPADRAADDVAVATAWAATRLWSDDADGAAGYLENAARSVERATPATRRVAAPALAALRIMQAAEQRRDDSALTRHGRAVAESTQASASTQAEHRAAGLLWFTLGCASLRRWDAGAASHALRQADRQLGAGGLTALRARTRAWLALAQACSGDLAAAQRAADDVRKQAIPVTREASFLAALGYAMLSLGRDDLAGAQRLLDEVDDDRAGHLPGEPLVTVAAALIRARVLLADGDPTAARTVLSRLRDAWAAACPGLSRVITVAEAEAVLRAGDSGRARALLLLADEGTRPGHGDAALAEADLLLSEGDFAGALEAARPYLDGGPVTGTTWERTRALLAAAVAQRRLGDTQAAAALAEAALGLAEPQGAYRVFLDGGSALRSAITVLVPPTSRYAGFAGRVLERFDSCAARPGGPAEQGSVRLTESERAVLCFLPSHMTNEEISEALFLSVNTVKTHLRSAYRKLGVGSRREAIARGRRLGLL
jgi:LuxR family maltose regulon positive regulatory protein